MSEEEKTREQRKEDRAYWQDDRFTIHSDYAEELLIREHWLTYNQC